jgi:predicted RNase H-like HicB family nuclease
MKYLVVVEKSSSGFGAYVPDLPGCVAAAETRAEVLALIREAIEFHIEGLRQAGGHVPEPTSQSEVVDVQAVPPLGEMPNNPLLARVAGWSLHAATVCEAHQRSRLERLCRYITRPPIATNRLTVDGRGRVMYRYKQPFRDGSTHVLLEPLDFMYRMYGMPRAQGCARLQGCRR